MTKDVKEKVSVKITLEGQKHKGLAGTPYRSKWAGYHLSNTVYKSVKQQATPLLPYTKFQHGMFYVHKDKLYQYIAWPPTKKGYFYRFDA
jgi:hypothetical protein